MTSNFKPWSYLIHSMVSKGLGHRTERAKEAGQKETDAILDCLKNAKDKIIELESMEKGEKYIKVAGKEDDPSSFMGSSWKSAYKTDDKNVADQMAAKMGTNLEWIGNAAKIITGLVPAIRFHKETQRKTWFNSLEQQWTDVDLLNQVLGIVKGGHSHLRRRLSLFEVSLPGFTEPSFANMVFNQFVQFVD
ncbi:hypothetical protein Tco_0945245, partial [Tanacetum coccineum]